MTVRVGAPIEADTLRERCGRNRALMMDVVGLRIAQELPPDYRGIYGTADAEDAGLAPAREIAASL